ncbi:MAG: hypothetical protein Q4D32_01085 [Eubacteriales bacterium]|nr:hypothetical protein [Eubacteriales bacterium]
MKKITSRYIRPSSTHVPRYFLFGLTIFCWFAALLQCLESQKNSSLVSPFIETTVPAYSTQSFKNSIPHCVYSHKSDEYNDYYFYSPVIKSIGIDPTSQGYNMHLVIKKDGHVYLGLPNITCDF